MADDVLKDALERFKQSQDGSSFNREDAVRDIAFARMGDQWDPIYKKQRDAEGRPCLTINRLGPLVRQVVNNSRQNKPSIVISPGDGDGDYDTAKIIGGLIRAIERNSNASLAYDTAVDHSATGGFGFFRICTDYVHEESFDQEARIERISNPFSVHWDTNTTAFDASDWEYAFVSDLLTPAEFKRAYGKKAKATSFEGGTGEDMADWMDGEKIRVAEYWLREERKRTIIQLSDGRVVREDFMAEAMPITPELTVTMAEFLSMQGVTVAGEREATYHEVTRRMMSGADVLSEESWLGSMIPICPVWGEEVLFEGRRHFRSLIRDARDPQKMFNFWRTASTELVALAPRAPWLVPIGGIPPGEEEKWRTANTRSHAYLTYDPSMGPKPERQAFAGVPAGALQEALNASDDIKSSTGIYDAALGARSNETSGRAIRARQSQTDTGTFHIIDNLSRAIQYAGRCLVEIIPRVYGQRQVVQILGADDKQEVVRLGKRDAPQADGEERLYDLSTGRYSVTVKTGPSYATQREEAADAIMQLIQSAPQAALVLGDLLVKNMDWPQADEAAERIQMLQHIELQKMMPPQPQGMPGGPQMGAAPMPQGPGNVPPG